MPTVLSRLARLARVAESLAEFLLWSKPSLTANRMWRVLPPIGDYLPKNPSQYGLAEADSPRPGAFYYRRHE